MIAMGVVRPVIAQTMADVPARRPAHLFVVCIGGADSDPTAEQIAGTAPRGRGNSSLYQLCGDLRRERVIAEYFNWNGSRAGKLPDAAPPRSRGIAAFVRDHLQRHPSDRVVIVGNSWGGQTAIEVARDLLQSETPLAMHGMIFLDASSVVRGRKPTALPINVNRAVNYYTHNAFAWGGLSADDRVHNIDLGDAANGYMPDGEPAYHAPFDIRAHIAAEWDERIHADMVRRLLDFLPTDGATR